MNDSQKYTIKASPELMRLLSSGLYSNKIFAVIRELVSNSLDAIKENNGDVTVKLYGNKQDGYWLQISDSGPGLSADETIALMSTYGNTTKSNNDSANGKFGVGSKAPFSYSNEFYIRSSKNGETHYFKCYKDDKGVPYIQHLVSEKTNQTGMDFRIKIEEKDLNSFFIYIMLFTAFQVTGTKLKTLIDFECKFLHSPLRGPYVNKDNAKTIIKIHDEYKPLLPQFDSDGILKKHIYRNITYNLIENFLNKHNYKKYNVYDNLSYSGVVDFIKKDSYWSYITGFTNCDGKLNMKIGNVDYCVPIDQHYEYENSIISNVVFYFNPKDIMLTGSRESIEQVEYNKQIMQNKINEFEAIFKNKIKNAGCIMDGFFSDDETAIDILEILYDSEYSEIMSLNSSVLSVLGINELHEFDKSIKYTANKYSSANCVNINVGENICFKKYNLSNNKSIDTTTIEICDSNKTVVCLFERRKVDVSKIIEKHTSNQVYFISNGDIETQLAAKKTVKNIVKSSWANNNIIVLSNDEISLYKREKKQKDNLVEKNKNNFTVYNIDDKNKLVAADDIDPNATHLFLFGHIKDAYVLKYFNSTESKPDIDTLSSRSAKSFIYHKSRDISASDIEWYLTSKKPIITLLNNSNKVQIIVFDKKKNLLKYLLTNSIDVDINLKINNILKKIIDEFPEILKVDAICEYHAPIRRMLVYASTEQFAKIKNFVKNVLGEKYAKVIELYIKYFRECNNGIGYCYEVNNVLENADKYDDLDKSWDIYKVLNFYEIFSYSSNIGFDINAMWNIYQMVSNKSEYEEYKDIIDKINIFKGIMDDL